jgi:MraZ protein
VKFRGKFEHTLDGKGRTSVPSRFREVFVELAKEDGAQGPSDESVIVTRSRDECLICFPRSSWYAFEENVAKLPPLSKRAKVLKRIFIAHAVELGVDKHGRILIPQALREYAGLERDVIWVGSLSNCEIWNPHRWEAALRESMDDDEVMDDALDELPF